MDSLKEVYSALKKFDVENKLSLNELEDLIELKIDNIRSACAEDDYYANGFENGWHKRYWIQAYVRSQF